MIQKTHCLSKVLALLTKLQSSFLENVSTFSTETISLVRVQSIFDKQHNLGNILNMKFLERFRVLPKSCSLEEEGKIFACKKFLGLIWKIAMFLYLYLKNDLSKVDSQENFKL